MGNEDQILQVLADVHLAVGKLQGTSNAILDEQETQNSRMTEIEGRLGRLETRQVLDEHEQKQATDAVKERRANRAHVVQGVWLTVAAVVGGGAGQVFHALGLG